MDTNNNLRIYSDNQACLLQLKTPSDKPGQNCLIRAINASRQIMNIGESILLHWVSGYMDIIGNKLTDKAAKQATQLESESNLKSFAILKSNIKELTELT